MYTNAAVQALFSALPPAAGNGTSALAPAASPSPFKGPAGSPAPATGAATRPVPRLASEAADFKAAEGANAEPAANNTAQAHPAEGEATAPPHSTAVHPSPGPANRSNSDRPGPASASPTAGPRIVGNTLLDKPDSNTGSADTSPTGPASSGANAGRATPATSDIGAANSGTGAEAMITDGGPGGVAPPGTSGSVRGRPGVVHPGRRLVVPPAAQDSVDSSS